MSLVDRDGLGELTVVERDGDSVVSDRNGNTVVTFHGLFGDYSDQPAWEAFLDGLQMRHPQISVFNETQGRYHISMGHRWIEAEGRYDNDAPASATIKP
ncbi:hypothetical protein OIU34_23250 [Pararhizobium sp. BT-229]|uniref:hypothetical protein n=1 Tax=Pararhizobium sp. BT-229 TaxID=2986923 RepID=UPI0021F70249|nr:hypothetical protein [Pararhizobium sp. BT-229]MCV9964813.1 hypothetical protein [Pararhizobium sp. BT-229]